MEAAYPEEMPCPKCGRMLAFTPRPDTMHFGSVKCPEHGFAWIPKPVSDCKPKRKSYAELVVLLPEEMRGYCWTCRRTREHLKSLSPSVSMHVHHISEKQHGGSDERDNLYHCCDECHAVIHRRREAFARYLNSEAA